MNPMKTLTINGATYNVTPVVPTSSVTLLASDWVGDGEAYSQVVVLPGVTLNTKVDLQPTPEQLEEFHYLTLAFVAENEGGVVTVYSIGDKPTNDHTIQTTLTEVEGTGTIRGNTVGTTMPRPDWNQEDPQKADYIKNKEPVNDHLANKENPHGVTASQVGARPSTWLPSPAEVGAVPAVESDAHPGCYYREVDGETEWINPPMMLGQVYRTTERYNGHPVYTACADSGHIVSTNPYVNVRVPGVSYMYPDFTVVGISAVVLDSESTKEKGVYCDATPYFEYIGVDCSSSPLVVLAKKNEYYYYHGTWCRLKVTIKFVYADLDSYYAND